MFSCWYNVKNGEPFMIRIDNRYLKNELTRNDSTVRNEVLASIFVEKYIYPNSILYIGTDPKKKLPDIHNKSNTLGFEVVRCEAANDFLHNDATKEFVKINHDYTKYLDLKNSNPEHIFNKVNLKLTVIDNKICASSTLKYGHSIDWMLEKYKSTIQKKLKKLNSGNYENCSNVSLVILNLSRANGILNAEQVRHAYSEEAQKYTLLFNSIYYITTDGIYFIDTRECKILKSFIDNEYSISVRKMKQLLKIDEYKNDLD